MAQAAQRSFYGDARAAVAAAVERAKPKRQGNGWLMATVSIISIGVGLTIGLIPVVGSTISAAVSHVVERFGNGIKANRELDVRAGWYRDQIGKTLGIDPRKVKIRGKHLEMAAAINPELAAAVRDVRSEESKDNKISAIANTAVAVIPGGTAMKEAVGVAKVVAGATHTAKVIGASTAGGLLVEWASKKHLNAQEIIEGISQQLEAAKAQGIDPKTVVTPNMVFALRVAQDEKLAAEIAATEPFKKPFHQLDTQQQEQIMYAYRPLANAAAAEAHAIARDILPVQELMARAPNLNGTAQYQIGQQASTFVGRVNAQRGAAANDPSFATAEEARRLAAMQAMGTRQA